MRKNECVKYRRGGDFFSLHRWQRIVHHVGARSFDIYAGICDRHAQNVLNLEAKLSRNVHPLPFYHPVVVMTKGTFRRQFASDEEQKASLKFLTISGIIERLQFKNQHQKKNKHCGQHTKSKIYIDSNNLV